MNRSDDENRPAKPMQPGRAIDFALANDFDEKCCIAQKFVDGMFARALYG
jgi:hypothetical protein